MQICRFPGHAAYRGPTRYRLRVPARGSDPRAGRRPALAAAARRPPRRARGGAPGPGSGGHWHCTLPPWCGTHSVASCRPAPLPPYVATVVCRIGVPRAVRAHVHGAFEVFLRVLLRGLEAQSLSSVAKGNHNPVVPRRTVCRSLLQRRPWRRRLMPVLVEAPAV
jgi:hypothetical protein